MKSFPSWLALATITLSATVAAPASVHGFAADALLPASRTPSAIPTLEHPLLAWWPFDEPAGGVCADASGHGHDATPEPGRGQGLSRVEGVLGRALNFAGSHLLRMPGRPDLDGRQALSLTVWVRPVAFERYNELFRKEDGERRVLFSFQEHGTILSLGLNVGGYFECDAKLDPAEALDGQWHLCAATFDGEWMRVYLDGREIGAQRRPGTVAAGGPAPGCIGSAHGGECFQGALDDLRIYGGALPAAEVAALYQSARPALDRFARELEQRLAECFVPRATYAETLAETRRRLQQRDATLPPDLAGALTRRLRQRHPQEYAEFARWTGVQPLAYLESADAAFPLREARRLLELLLEYKPLTETQWRNQTPAELAQWQQADALAAQVDALEARGAEAQFSPAWIELLLDIGRRVQLRPYLQEAVAPYVRPQTPPTRNLTAAEAQAALERDWLHQADQRPSPERIRQEITWARELAARLQELFPSPTDAALATALEALDQLEPRAASLTAPDPALYFEVRALKRQIAFRNPRLDFDRVLFVDMPFPQGSEWQHETRHRLGYMAVPGGRLTILEGLSPAGKLRQLMPQPPLHGSFWRPDLSYDARQVLFCFKPHNEKSFHLYEIGVDGTGLRQLTEGPYDDLDPVYLPDERHVIFSTTRGHTYVRCMPPTSAFVLARCDRDGQGLALISANNEPDYLPSVLNDGRVVYTRWEYTDKPLWRAQKLWTVYPDGTRVNTLWGNQSVWPDLVKDARSIPGSRRIMFTGSAHHDWFAGSLGFITPDAGFNFPHGLTKITADLAWPECGNGPVDPIESPRYHSSGRYAAYYSPYPLSEEDFLVSANRAGKFVLYLMDVHGNRELIYEGANHIFHALPLKPRPRPPVLPDSTDLHLAQDGETAPAGVFYSADVYQGAPEELRGRAKFLRVLTIDHKTYTYWHKRPYISTGPVVSGVQSDGVKRVLGTVPIEPDGSVNFRAPAGLPLHFQLLDADQRALQTMRSFANLMPGESRGCLGCHELHSTAPPTVTSALALAQPPRAIAPPPWPDTSVSYTRYVRPVLDRYCADCHTGDGEGRATLDLTARPGFLGFDEVYWLFTGHPSWGQPYQPPPDPPPGWGIADTLMVEAYGTTDPAGYRTPPPMTVLSFKSRLIELAAGGDHHEVRVDPVNLLRLQLWVDTMCPYRGDEEIREIPDPDFQGVEWLAVRPRIQTAPRIPRPGPP